MSNLTLDVRRNLKLIASSKEHMKVGILTLHFAYITKNLESCATHSTSHKTILGVHPIKRSLWFRFY